MEKAAIDHIASRGGEVTGRGFFNDGRYARVGVMCAKYHYWEPRINNLVHSHSWCPECYGNSPGSLDDLVQHATARGGECLSTEYINTMRKYLWRCGMCDQTWEASWNNVRNRDSWCPNCKINVGEEIARSAFEENLPGYKFPNSNETGFELDGYCPELCLAFEYDGIQHRQFEPHFHATHADFEAQKYRDAVKDKLCWDIDIALVRIPDAQIVPHTQLREYCRNSIAELGYDILPSEETKPDADFMSAVYTGGYANVRYMADLEPLANEGFRLVSTNCPTRTWPLTVICPHDHTYTTTYDNIIRGRRCPKCSSTAIKEQSELREIAASFRCELLVYEHIRGKNGRSRLYVTVKCINGHLNTYMWDNFRVRGCHNCVSRKGKARRLAPDIIAQRLGNWGLELAGEYMNRSTPTLFRCIQAHVFTAKLVCMESYMVGRDIACPICYIHTFPQKFDVECIFDSVEYFDQIGTTGPLNWKCLRCGILFIATLTGMQRRTHKCPKC